MEEASPVQWSGRQAVVVLPEHIDLSNSAVILEELLSVIDRGATALIADMTAMASCGHSGADAIARAGQRALASGTDLSLVVPSPAVRRALSIYGVDRLVSVCLSRGAALAAPEPTAARAQPMIPAGRRGASTDDSLPDGAAAAPGLGTEAAVLDRHGVIVWVNDAWTSFAAANQGDPARTGVGMSYLEACAAAGDDPVALEVAAATRRALAGDLPGPLTVEVPCHSPGTARWFDVLISSRRDDDERPLGATVTLSLSRSEPRAAAPGAPQGAEPADSRHRVMRQLLAAGPALDAALDLLGDHPAAGSVRDAASHLELAISDLRDGPVDRRGPLADRQ